MIQVIHGNKGSGKTKRILDQANDAIKEHKGDVIFIDDDNRYMYDLRHEVRFVNASEYGTDSPEMFFGFLCGMLSCNFDIGTVFIDAFLDLCHAPLEETEGVVKTLAELGEKHSVDFVLSLSADPDMLPDHLKQYLI